MGRLLAAFLLLLSGSSALSAQVLINEYAASNLDTIQDIDGDTPDWIELRNASAMPLDLAGYAISDDPLDPQKWLLPSLTLQPNDLLLLFASGKDRGQSLDWDTIIDDGATWRYFPGSSEPPADWADLQFDDSSWSMGASALGHGYSNVRTVVGAETVYLRHTFALTQAQLDFLRQLWLHVDFDDGFVAYLNGTEVARENVGFPGVGVAHDELAFDTHRGVLQWSQPPPGYRVDGFADLLQVGLNTLAVQAHNYEPFGGDLCVSPFLTLGMDPATATGSLSSWLSMPVGEFHTNFKLSAFGETLSLIDPLGAVVDTVDTGRVYAGESRGRTASGGTAWFDFLAPTPGAPNSNEGRAGFAGTPLIAPAGGVVMGAKTVTLTAPSPGATLYYTTDGSEPTTASTYYAAPFQIGGNGSEVVPLRVRSFENGLWPSRIETASFLIDPTHRLPVWSIASEPSNLWDPIDGIYENFAADIERPFHAEFFEVDGSRVFSGDLGMRIHGGATRSYPQKTLALYLRSGYGPESVDYPLFGDVGLPSFKRLMLRNSGQDWLQSMLRDGLAHTIMYGEDIDAEAHRPAVVYLNGEYWGIHNIREKIDKYYAEAHHGADVDDLDLLEFDGWIVHAGDSAEWFTLVDYILGGDMAQPDQYAVAEQMIDVDEFANYIICEVFFNNLDWPDNNVKYWKGHGPGWRWRWFFYDCDGGLGNWGTDASYNMLSTALTGGQNVCKIFAALCDSDRFRERFVNRYADLLNTTLNSDTTLGAFEWAARPIRSEMPAHMARWNGNMSDWPRNLRDIGRFLVERPAYARQHIAQEFGLSGTYELGMRPWPPGSGAIELTAATADDIYIGTYFLGVPLELTAAPAAGWEFDRWSDPSLPQQSPVTIDPPGDYQVGAIFKRRSGYAVIHEINYNSDAAFDPEDWFEIYNPGNTRLDLAGWTVRDENDANLWSFPAGAAIPDGGYLVVCRNLAAFQAHFPGVTAVGGFGFGLGNGGDSVRLFDASGSLVDSVTYDDQLPWPTEPDGGGPTLQLIDAGMDNGVAASWTASSVMYGTPGS